MMRSDGAILVADVPASGPRIEWNSAALEPQAPRSLSGPFYGGALIHGVGHVPAPLFMNKRTGIGLDGGTRLFTMDPSSGALTYSAEIRQSHESFDAGDVVPSDYNGDGTEEVFYGAADFADVFQGAYNFYGNQQIFRSTAMSGIGPTVDIAEGDLNGDGVKDLVALTSAGYLCAYDVSSGQQLLDEWVSGGVAVEVANIDGAGGPEIVVLGGREVFVYARGASPTLPFVRTRQSGPYDFASAGRRRRRWRLRDRYLRRLPRARAAVR